MRVIFMGTPDFAVGALEAILLAGHEVVLAVTQPDKPKGRGKEMQFPPVKEAALSHGIEVFQPVKIREDANVEYLRSFDADIIVVAAFGQILPKSILDMPPLGCINIHASLLPKYRGAAPIQWAIINGDEETGVTIMRMDVGVDTGDMIAKKCVPIAKDETGGSLFDKLKEVGGTLCVEVMEQLKNQTAVYTPQDPQESSHTKMISKELGNIDWSAPAITIERLVRGLNPWPSAYTFLNDKTFKIWKSQVIEETTPAPAGSVVRTDREGIYVQTGDNLLLLQEVQMEGKKRMRAADFCNGYAMDNIQLMR